MNDDELRLYQQIYEHLKPQAPAPDLVIYLQASAETLIERVQRRGASLRKAAYRMTIWCGWPKPTRGFSISTTRRRC